jgi:hypothetical protein
MARGGKGHAPRAETVKGRKTTAKLYAQAIRPSQSGGEHVGWQRRAVNTLPSDACPLNHYTTGVCPVLLTHISREMTPTLVGRILPPTAVHASPPRFDGRRVASGGKNDLHSMAGASYVPYHQPHTFSPRTFYTTLFPDAGVSCIAAPRCRRARLQRSPPQRRCGGQRAHGGHR